MPIAKQRPKPAQNGVCRLAVQLLVDDRLDKGSKDRNAPGLHAHRPNLLHDLIKHGINGFEVLYGFVNHGCLGKVSVCSPGIATGSRSSGPSMVLTPAEIQSSIAIDGCGRSFPPSKGINPKCR